MRIPRWLWLIVPGLFAAALVVGAFMAFAPTDDEARPAELPARDSDDGVEASDREPIRRRERSGTTAPRSSGITEPDQTVDSGPVEVSGRLVDQNGFPVRGVSLRHPEGVAELDDDGRFEIMRPDRAPFEVRFMIRPETEMQSARIDPTVGTIVIRAEDVPRIRGTLRHEDGAPLPGIVVSFGRKTSWNDTVTDAAGGFEVPADVVGNTVHVRSAPAQTHAGPVLSAHGRARLGAPLDLIAPVGVLLQGRVIDPDGQPVSEASITAGQVDSRPTTTGPDGRFTIVVRRGRPNSLLVRTETRGLSGDRFPQKAISIPPSSDGRLGDIRLERGATLDGVLVDAEGQPLPVVQLAFRHHAGGTTFLTTTDSAGRFTIGGLLSGPPGAFRLVRDEGLTRGHMLLGDIGAVAGRTASVRLVRVPARRVSGRCVEIDGARRRRYLRISVPGLGSSIHVQTSYEDGKFELWVPSRPCVLQINLKTGESSWEYRDVLHLDRDPDRDTGDLEDIVVDDPYRR